MEYEFIYQNLTCYSLELHWRLKNGENNALNNYKYELSQKEGSDNMITNLIYFKTIYKGKNNNYEVVDLKPNQEYTFKLNVEIEGKSVDQKKITVKTLKAPHAILSENSIKIVNGENIEYNNELSDSQKKIIKHCSKLIFENTNENNVKGIFDGIEIKIGHESESNRYYISFDIVSCYLEKFFDKFIEESENNIIIPCHFIIQKLPTTLIFNLLDEGSVILTGKRMGGVIASSLAFYILFGKSKDLNYDNAFMKRDKKCIGVVTFGSPSFVTKSTTAVKMKEITPYFYHIKEEFDYIPEIIDYIRKNHTYKEMFKIIHKTLWNNKDTEILDNYIKNNDFNENNLKSKIDKFRKIPFGYYYIFNASNSKITPKNEYTFEDFYYFKIFHSNNSTYNSKIYENLASKIKFNKEKLCYLENRDYKLDLIKIIRRNINSNLMKGIIKFKLIKFNNNIIPPDIIEEIILKSKTNTYTIYNKDIYYDNNEDITAYIDNLNENINKVIIINNFGGEIEVKQIMNIQGSGSTREMLKNDIEKLFLIPFFKLFEIFYISCKDNEKYNQLKEENFGEDFSNLKILKPFEQQIQILNDLLILSRPDILGNFEKEFINEYIKEKLTEEQKNNLDYKIKTFYEQALKSQREKNINCLDSQVNSIAKKCPFPDEIKGNKEIKKLFMFKNDYFYSDNFFLKKIDESYMEMFFIDKLIKETLKNIEEEIIKNLNDKNDEESKSYLNDKIGQFCNDHIIPYIYFILINILSSIESGDEIIFSHNSWKNFLYSLFIPRFEDVFYILDYEKQYAISEIEELNMKNMFNKIKTKNIVKSNIYKNENSNIININDQHLISPDNKNFFLFSALKNIMEFVFLKNNSFKDFAEYSKFQKYGYNYYIKFLAMLNNYSNEFPEDIEISIYDNLKEENINKEGNLNTIKDMMNHLIRDEESQKGFLALLRQSYLLGKLRCNIVRNYIINFYFYRKMNIL